MSRVDQNNNSDSNNKNTYIGHRPVGCNHSWACRRADYTLIIITTNLLLPFIIMEYNYYYLIY